jgi:glycosyltransferase involved in cell wall biosynthesis
MSRVDLLFLACNRRAFTEESFRWLLAHTDWALVRLATLWDDGSQDGTEDWLAAQAQRVPAPCKVEQSRIGSPVAVKSRWIAAAEAPYLAMIDNDVMLPPGWLNAAVAALDAAPELDFLGLEALCPVAETHEGPRGYRPATVVSGLGLYRRAAFTPPLPEPIKRWFGFAEWQAERRATIRAGWIDPALPVFLLDRLPMEPWRSLSQAYAARGWHRPWQAYAPDRSDLWNWRWPGAVDLADPPAARVSRDFDIVILSASPANLRAAVAAILAREPAFDPGQIIVVDDGAGTDKTGIPPSVRWVQGTKPFNYARNANIGIAASQRDVILLNDDAVLETPAGFTTLAAANGGRGIISAAVRGVVGNPNQNAGRRGIWPESSVLCFVCVHLPRTVLDRVGPLDEDFVGYGFEDNDYCDRARAARFALSVCGDCVVDHGHTLRSTFRSNSQHAARFAQNKAIYEAKRVQAAAHRFLGVMRVKNEAAHIAEVIQSLLPLCAEVLVFDDNSTDATPDICKAFGPAVTVIHSPFQGLDEARDKGFLLPIIAERAPDWVIWIDGDEVLPASAPALIRKAAADPRDYGTMTFDVAYIWDHDDRIRVDGIFGRMQRPSAFRFRPEDAARLRFRQTRGVNLHCGNVPLGVRGPDIRPGVRLKHYGYVTAEQRARKYAWYTSVDPGNAAEDHYRHLKGEPGARFAPGKPVLQKWQDETP